MRLVIALGGNALLRRGQPADAETQRRNAAGAARAIAAVAANHDVIVTHGNGPQIGLLALQAAATPNSSAYPLDILGAETEGMIGYLLEQELRSSLPDRSIATLLTQVAVDAGDPAFDRPTKPIGPVYDDASAVTVGTAHGWTMARDGDRMRRVVASPEPVEILELETIERLLDAGTLVICAGGGGIPVVHEGGICRGVEAVVDKDLTAALLAESVHADRLVLLTDVGGVISGWNTPSATLLRHLDVKTARALDLPAGSMGPKVEAACRFAVATGRTAAIGALDEAVHVVDGRLGTAIAITHAPPVLTRAW